MIEELLTDFARWCLIVGLDAPTFDDLRAWLLVKRPQYVDLAEKVWASVPVEA